MKRATTIQFIGLVLCASTSTLTAQSCTTCHDFTTSNNGWFASPSGIVCGPYCTSTDPSCRKDCFIVRSVSSIANDRNPGILLIQERGKLLVASVLPNSPAAKLGVVAGDEIAFINGKQPGWDCAAGSWAQEEGKNTAVIEIRRHDVIRTVTVGLLPWAELHLTTEEHGMIGGQSGSVLSTSGNQVLSRVKAVVTPAGIDLAQAK